MSPYGGPNTLPAMRVQRTLWSRGVGASSVSHSEIRMVAVTFIKLLYAGLYPPPVLSFNSQDETEAGGQREHSPGTWALVIQQSLAPSTKKTPGRDKGRRWGWGLNLLVSKEDVMLALGVSGKN